MAAGRKTGGRKKGSKNKATLARLEQIDKSGKTPLQFLLDRMRNTKAPMAERIDCAKAAAPYIHPRLSAVEVGGIDGDPIKIALEDAKFGLLSQLDRIAEQRAKTKPDPRVNGSASAGDSL